MHCKVLNHIVFWCSLKSSKNKGKKLIIWLILWSFSFTPSYDLWIIPQFFVKLKVLFIYIIVACFTSVAFVVGKLKILKVFHTDSASTKWSLIEGFLRPNSPKYGPILLKFSPEVVITKKKRVF